MKRNSEGLVSDMCESGVGTGTWIFRLPCSLSQAYQTQSKRMKTTRSPHPFRPLHRLIKVGKESRVRDSLRHVLFFRLPGPEFTNTVNMFYTSLFYSCHSTQQSSNSGWYVTGCRGTEIDEWTVGKDDDVQIVSHDRNAGEGTTKIQLVDFRRKDFYSRSKEETKETMIILELHTNFEDFLTFPTRKYQLPKFFYGSFKKERITPLKVGHFSYEILQQSPYTY